MVTLTPRAYESGPGSSDTSGRLTLLNHRLLAAPNACQDQEFDPVVLASS
jgi:hypothetical protein